MKLVLSALITVVLLNSTQAQSISEAVPGKIDASSKYLFYLHGAIVNSEDRNPTSSYFGKYEYDSILSALANSGFHVISEARPKDVQEVDYAKKVSRQIDNLLQAGVPLSNITIVGASLGAYITIELANIRKQQDLKYVLLGLCSDYAVEYYQKYRSELCGNFLSIYEASDQKKSCQKILENENCKQGFKEISLTMGNGHSFLYQPYSEWIDPLLGWLERN